MSKPSERLKNTKSTKASLSVKMFDCLLVEEIFHKVSSILLLKIQNRGDGEKKSGPETAS